MSTIGFGYGFDETGQAVTFSGDHRPMRDLGEALARAAEPPVVDLEDWQVIS
jgi:hypothetical protein